MNAEQLAALTEEERKEYLHGHEPNWLASGEYRCYSDSDQLWPCENVRLLTTLANTRLEVAQLKTDWEAVCVVADERKTMCWEAIYKARALEAEVARLTEERERVLLPIDSYACQRCGRRDGLDAGVTNEIWAELSEAAGGATLLCLWCMDELATQSGISASVMLWFAGRALSGCEGPTTWDDNKLTDLLLESQTRTVQAIAERDQQREDIRRLVEALEKVRPIGEIGRLLAEMKERYSA